MPAASAKMGKTETLAWLRRISAISPLPRTGVSRRPSPGSRRCRLRDARPSDWLRRPASARSSSGRRPEVHSLDRGRHLRRGATRAAPQRQPHADPAAHPRHGRGDRGAGGGQGRAPSRSDPALLSRGRVRGRGRLCPGRRGAWAVGRTAEALVVDSILTGEADEELPSRIAALGWHGHGEVSVLVGTTPPLFDVDQLRRTARKLGVDVLIGVQGSRLVLVLGRAEPPNRIDDGPIGPAVPRDRETARARLRQRPPRARAGGARRSSTRARAPARRSAASRSHGRGGTRRAPSRLTTFFPSAPSPAIRSPSRHSSSASTDRSRLTAPISSRRCGATSTTAARSRRPRASCSCIPNTVRYRLKRVSEVIGWDATGPARGADPADGADPRLHGDGCRPPTSAGGPKAHPTRPVRLAQSFPPFLRRDRQKEPPDPWQDGTVIIAVFPGQGSQSPGFLTPGSPSTARPTASPPIPSGRAST